MTELVALTTDQTQPTSTKKKKKKEKSKPVVASYRRELNEFHCYGNLRVFRLACSQAARYAEHRKQSYNYINYFHILPSFL